MKLKQVYKANQCTDLTDVENAIDEVLHIIRWNEAEYKPTKAAYKRLISLEKRKKHFQRSRKPE